MSITIENNQESSYTTQQSNDNSKSFNDLVLEHIKDNQPEGSLDELLYDMKALSPDKPCTIDQLSTALQYSDTILRNDPDYVDYTTEILDQRTTQLLGVKMFVKMMTDRIEEIHRNGDDSN